jgi:hypothetical protein
LGLRLRLASARPDQDGPVACKSEKSAVKAQQTGGPERHPHRARYIGALLLLVGIAGCAGSLLAEKFLVGVAIGIAASVVLRVALNTDPEE